MSIFLTLFCAVIIVGAIAMYIDLSDDPDLFKGMLTPRQFVFLFAYLTVLTVFMSGGVEKLLFFVPDSWGTVDEDGYFLSYRKSFSFTVGFLIALWFGCFTLPELLNKKEEKNGD